jgi:hypothetical protein
VEAVHKAKSKVHRRVANQHWMRAPAVQVDSAAAAKAMKIEVLKAEGRAAISRREIRSNLHSSPSPWPILHLASALMAILNKCLLAHAQLALCLLAETHGVMVYQEQVMRILERLGGIEGGGELGRSPVSPRGRSNHQPLPLPPMVACQPQRGAAVCKDFDQALRPNRRRGACLIWHRPSPV